MHPSCPLVAVGLVTGRVQVFDAGAQSSTMATTAAASTKAVTTTTAAAAPSTPSSPLVSVRASSSSSRAVSFSADGSALYVGDAEGNLTSIDVSTGKVSARLLQNANGGSAFTRLVAALLVSSSNNSSSFLPATSVISGDEAGTVRVWDPRCREPAVEFSGAHQGGEQVSDLLPLPAGAAAGLKSNTSEASSPATTTTGGVVSVGSDGTLALLDFARAGGKSNGIASRSDPDEDELLCLGFAKNFSTLCCGSAGGVLSLWKPRAAGGLAGCADRLPLARLSAKEGGERPAINSLASLDGAAGSGAKSGGGGGSLLLAGCADGKLRVLSVLPNKVLCTLGGAHGDGREVLRARTGGNGSGEGGFCSVAASVAAPSKSLCLWSCEALRASAASAASAVAASAGVGGKRARRRQAEAEDESSDDEEDEEESDDDDEEEEAAPKKGKASASRPDSFFDGIVS